VGKPGKSKLPEGLLTAFICEVLEESLLGRSRILYIHLISLVDNKIAWGEVAKNFINILFLPMRKSEEPFFILGKTAENH